MLVRPEEKHSIFILHKNFGICIMYGNRCSYIEIYTSEPELRLSKDTKPVEVPCVIRVFN